MSDNVEPAFARDPEIHAIGAVYEALRALDSGAQKRVLDYVLDKLSLPKMTKEVINDRVFEQTAQVTDADNTDTASIEDLHGIDPAAQRWIRRSHLAPQELGKIFSIGAEEIDLVASRVPGETKKDRMRNVLILRAMAFYLASGTARTGHKEAKEACMHYDAWDSANFATYLKSFASDISGSKDTGYALTARGMASATEMIKAMVG